MIEIFVKGFCDDPLDANSYLGDFFCCKNNHKK